MSDRKNNINLMNLLVKIYNGSEKKPRFSLEQVRLLQELVTIGFLNPSAIKFIGDSQGVSQCAMTGEYPLTIEGKEYMEMGWYKSLQQSGKYQLVRDIAAFIGAAAGVVIGILKIIYG
ncbi:MAG: hypothetical protein JW807_12730 [Spirochaetes bacterium]|nr:hypothetical protein [Spirochaetota bacterium]